MTLKSLDFESQSVYIISVIATDLGSPPLSSTVNVTINVIDEFDKKIQFSNNVYLANFATEKPVSSFIMQVSTGLNGVVYGFTDGNENNNFKINSTTGVIESNKVFYTTNTFLLSTKAQFLGHPNVSTSSKIN
ncbi:hypothetical protein KUTeg_003341 [Tegillarca granosa]|uniref:Cadherin domain-containing protein n=1 Tax=Tegillarca granosa TaxID=220873 RepID=A0ABQ9FPS0_TEGGR|nr:hypothetical protein KUTeg_003341 [Tegillarca granosa]